MGINRRLMQLADQALRQKRAFVAAGGDPSAGGMPPGGAPPGGMPPGGPPMDPSMMGGAPPGGMPPGGAPPMDPSMMGGAPPGGPPPMDPSMMGGGGSGGSDIRSAIRDELAAAGLIPQGKPGMAGKPAKADINTIATDVFQLKKMFLHFMRSQNQELPPDILDGPNRDPVTGAPTVSQDGSSDNSGGAPASPAGPAGTIQPPSPIQPAFSPGPGGGGGGGDTGSSKTASYTLGSAVRLAPTRTTTEAQRLAQLFAR